MARKVARVVKTRKPALSPGELQRRFVFETMGNHDWETDVLIDRMQKVCSWLTTGELPKRAGKKGTVTQIRPVPDAK